MASARLRRRERRGRARCLGRLVVGGELGASPAGPEGLPGLHLPLPGGEAGGLGLLVHMKKPDVARRHRHRGTDNPILLGSAMAIPMPRGRGGSWSTTVFPFDKETGPPLLRPRLRGRERAGPGALPPSSASLSAAGSSSPRSGLLRDRCGLRPRRAAAALAGAHLPRRRDHRAALPSALSRMISDGLITRAQALEIGKGVLREKALTPPRAQRRRTQSAQHAPDPLSPSAERRRRAGPSPFSSHPAGVSPVRTVASVTSGLAGARTASCPHAPRMIGAAARPLARRRHQVRPESYARLALLPPRRLRARAEAEQNATRRVRPRHEGSLRPATRWGVGHLVAPSMAAPWPRFSFPAAQAHARLHAGDALSASVRPGDRVRTARGRRPPSPARSLVAAGCAATSSARGRDRRRAARVRGPAPPGTDLLTTLREGRVADARAFLLRRQR